MLRSLLTALALLVLTTEVAYTQITNKDLSLNPRVQTLQIKALIDEVFADYSAADRKRMKVIADCESGGKNKSGGPNGLITHLDSKGRLVKNSRTGAAGATQIYAASHSRTFWARQSLNPNEIYDNIVYARALADERKRVGQYVFADWTASSACYRQG